MGRSLSVFILAGEPSGDALGAALIRGLREEGVELTLRGLGGSAMQAEGLKPLFPMSELSVMGIAEVLPRLRGLFKRLDQCEKAVIDGKPDIVVTIDSPDFSFRLQKRLARSAPHIRRVHYVAPTVWAWRPGRAVKVAGFLHQLLALLPFEPPYFKAHGLDCRFVGHPIAERRPRSSQEVAAFRSRHGLGDRPVMLVLPGSRSGEIRRMGPVFAEVVGRFKANHPETVPVLISAQGAWEQMSALQGMMPKGSVLLPDGPEKWDVFSAASLALAASGTVSVELAAHRTPMVIGYDVNWLSRLLLSFLLQTKTVTLVNLISDQHVVPECLGRDCQPDRLLSALEAVYSEPDAQLAALDMTMERLGKFGDPPGLLAARALIDGWDNRDRM